MIFSEYMALSLISEKWEASLFICNLSGDSDGSDSVGILFYSYINSFILYVGNLSKIVSSSAQ